MDESVYKVQSWLNYTYVHTPGFEPINQDGITGWSTVKALIRALQVEIGVAPDGDFGPGTLAKCPTISSNTTNENLILILQGGLYCKGYNPIGFDGQFGTGTQKAVASLQADAGLPMPTDGIATPVILKAILNMDAFVNMGDAKIRSIQQYLNNKYFTYLGPKLGLIPCDGIYSSKTNRAVIYGLQVEQGNTNPDGVFGPTTLSLCPTLNIGNTKTNFIVLFQYALYVNDYKTVQFNGVYDQTLKSIVTEFQRFSALGADGIAGKQTWASLLVSTGDRNRKGTACDCVTEITRARAQTLKANGYTTIGRYIIGGDWKRLKPRELDVIFEAGLKVFPIFQTSGNNAKYFRESQGKKDAISAMEAAEQYGFKKDTIIYFAVDYDAVDHEVTSNILPHFKGIYDKIQALGGKYRVGIYGPRNVCSRVAAVGYAVTSFVCDMSTGFSGNLGYPLPKNWAFDQISTISIGSGDGKIEIDNNIASGRDTGVSSVDPGVTDKYLNAQNELFFEQLDKIFDLAMEYSSNNVYRSNQLVLQFYRHRNYDGILWDLTANPIDEKFIDFVKSKIADSQLEVMYDLDSKIVMDVPHMIATTHGYTVLVDNSIVAELAGWAGDLITAAGDVNGGVQRNKYASPYEAAINIIGSSVNDSTFDFDDLLADVDAVYLANQLNNNPSAKINTVIRNRFSVATPLRDKLSYFVTNKFGTLDNLQTQAEYILITDTPVTYALTRAAFKSNFKNTYGDSISYTDAEGKEIARGFRDVISRLMN
ncbi:DUF1906 domain-containing protein [Paenibacillus sp. E222]|uniref:glycoside hydrolase domain-containing protein n=1 Tax=Paenibacillus sp. E222 TaxID=2748863 RepID=UPI0015C64A55|nr:glycoside hydrolase domain-containing protein [Paenibacillus sp. E222]QLG38567.1 DUF1906 domain-containing protein [Paenibacillus sp. E222]